MGVRIPERGRQPGSPVTVIVEIQDRRRGCTAHFFYAQIRPSKMRPTRPFKSRPDSNLMAAEGSIKLDVREDLRQLALDRNQYTIAVASAVLAYERVINTRLRLQLLLPMSLLAIFWNRNWNRNKRIPILSAPSPGSTSIKLRIVSSCFSISKRSTWIRTDTGRVSQKITDPASMWISRVPIRGPTIAYHPMFGIPRAFGKWSKSRQVTRSLYRFGKQV